MKKSLCFTLVFLMILLVIFPSAALAAPKNNKKAAPLAASAEQTVYLKGSGSEFTGGWNNQFYLGGAQSAADPSIWHIVYTGKELQSITAVRITFTNGVVWNWDQSMGFSTNQGGNNPGWVLVAPADWNIAYVDRGNANESGSWLTTTESKPGQFNISGHHRGTPEPQGSSASLNFGVTKTLAPDAIALLDFLETTADFTFSLTLYVDGVLYPTEPVSITGSGAAAWQIELESDEPGKVWEIQYTIAEAELYGFVLLSSSGTEGAATISDGGRMSTSAMFTNDLAYASSSGDTAAAFPDGGNTFGPYGNDAWHFVSFDRDDNFEVRAGQHFVVATGYLTGDEPVFTWVHPGVQLRNLQIAFSDNARALSALPPGQLRGGEGQFARLHWAAHYALLLPRERSK